MIICNDAAYMTTNRPEPCQHPPTQTHDVHPYFERLVVPGVGQLFKFRPVARGDDPLVIIFHPFVRSGIHAMRGKVALPKTVAKKKPPAKATAPKKRGGQLAPSSGKLGIPIS